MKSTLVLYEDSQILIDKNIKVDYIGDYLNTLTKLTLNNLNYIEPKRELSLKLELSQTNLDMGSDNTHNYNYAKITTDNVDYYYFIINYKWIAVSVIAIDLYMDTINSFVFKNQGESGLVDYEITPKTLIHRQHKDRWEYDEESSIMPFTPLIDNVNEGINPVLYKRSEHKVEDNNSLLLNQKWYLVYINHNQIVETDYNQVNPVDILIAPEHSTPVATSYQITLTPSMLNEGYTGISSYIQDDKNEAIEVDITGTTYVLEWTYGSIGVHAGKKWIWIRIYKAHASSLNFDVDIMQTITGDLDTPLYTSVLQTYTGITAIDLFNPPSKLRGYYQATSFTWATFYNKTYSPSSSTEIAYGIDSLDRTDSRLIKVIELPYCPLEVDNDLTSNGVIYFTKNVALDNDEDFIKISPNRFGFEQKRGAFKHKISIKNYVFPYELTNMIEGCIASEFYTDDTKREDLEAKLYSSEFYQTKFVYDSFNTIIAFERLAMWESLMSLFDENQDIWLELDTPITIASKFGFDILGLEPYNSNEDYDLFLPVARNNELPIYSSQYINYLRTGFNYDIKAKNQQASASGMSIGLATLGAVAGIGLGIASNNPAVLAGSIISAVTAVTSAVSSAVNTAITNQRSIEQKLAQAKAQAVNIQGCDDIDLLDIYTGGNKLKICQYECSPVMRKNAFDLFFYTGYKVEALGLPDTTSRMRFNYVSADIDIIMQKHLPKDIVDDIKARWSLGITFMHKLTTDLTRYPYNFEQDLENWEWSLEEALEVSE